MSPSSRVLNNRRSASLAGIAHNKPTSGSDAAAVDRDSFDYERNEREPLNPSYDSDDDFHNTTRSRSNSQKEGLLASENVWHKPSPRTLAHAFARRRNPRRSLPGPLVRHRPRGCSVLLILLVPLALVGFLLSAGRGYEKYAVLKRPAPALEGLSPPWYPTPRGGTLKAWEEAYKKAAEMVRRMSLVEKVNITTGTGWMMGPCVGNTGPVESVGFPSLCLQDGPLGIRFADSITATPAGITVGATWNKELMYKRGRLLGLEARLKGINVLLGPSVGPLGRMPAGGRNFEGFGADPVLQGRAAAETIRGIQEEGVMATIKHFVGNEQEHYRQANEWGIPHAISANIDDRTLHEMYAWPFADSIKAGVASVMCSYNQVNNSYACQNSKLLNGILKDELGFQGFIQSDWLAQRGGVASALAGLDMSMPGDGETWADGESLWGPQLTASVLNGSVPLERINDMVTRVVASWFKLGQDDRARWPNGTDGGPNFSSWTREEKGLLHPGSPDQRQLTVVNKFVDVASTGGYTHRGLVRRIAAEGIVMLRNEGNLLPLDRNGTSQRTKMAGREHGIKVAIVGEDAVNAEDGPNSCADRGCNKGTLASGWGSGAVEFPYLVSPAEALMDAFYESVNVTLIPTNRRISRDDKLDEHDICIVFANSDGGEGFVDAVDGVKGDRNNLKLQKEGERLIANVASMCGTKIGRPAKSGNVIVVIHSVGPVDLESFIEHPNVGGVLFAGLPGQESGNALADVLFGSLSPSGHLPFTIGKRLQDYGPGAKVMYKWKGKEPVPQQLFGEGLLVDYRHFDEKEIEPRFSFGYGLTYSTFGLFDLKVDSAERPPAMLPGRPENEVVPPDYSNQTPPSASEALPPSGLQKLTKYIYPYINDRSDARENSLAWADLPDLSKQPPKSQAGGGEGGHPALWQKVATIECNAVNLGDRDGQVVVQLYVGFPPEVYEEYEDDGGTHAEAHDGPVTDTPEQHGEHSAEKVAKRAPATRSTKKEKIFFPKRVLRGFEKVETHAKNETAPAAGHIAGVKFELTRRDLSYWSTRQQSWVMPEGTFDIAIGFSSRDIRLRTKLF